MEKKRFKISIIDIIIVLVFALVIILGVNIINKTQISSSYIPDVEFTVEVKQQDEAYADEIKVGDDIYDSVKGGYFGKVTKVTKEPASTIAEDTVNGRYIKSYYDNKYDVYVTISGTPGTYNDKTIMFASKEVRVGEEAFIRNKNYTGKGYIVEVNVLDNEAGGDK